ncbi:hypothetical protein B0H14DRAFT_3689607 [Mycena olivaceomarginata]|nr:hypothetical protein B0H14DRAFT_3689607 [Mycena olivaceomarginata]
MATATSSFTCNTCSAVFETNEVQRAHMREPWHLYNLKRRMVSLHSWNSAASVTPKSGSFCGRFRQLGSCRISAHTFGKQHHRQRASFFLSSIIAPTPAIPCPFPMQPSVVRPHPSTLPASVVLLVVRADFNLHHWSYSHLDVPEDRRRWLHLPPAPPTVQRSLPPRRPGLDGFPASTPTLVPTTADISHPPLKSFILVPPNIVASSFDIHASSSPARHTGPLLPYYPSSPPRPSTLRTSSSPAQRKLHTGPAPKFSHIIDIDDSSGG